MSMLGKKTFVPRQGQWVHGHIPVEDMANRAVMFGAWKTRKNKFCGIYSGSSATPEGVVVLPERIMLVTESGANVVGMVPPAGVANLWLLAPHDVSHLDEEQLKALVAGFAELGCIGVADQLEPVQENLDCPPGRRPDIHPKDLHKPIPVGPGHNLAEVIRRGVASIHKELGLPSPDEVERQQQEAQKEKVKGEQPSKEKSKK